MEPDLDKLNFYTGVNYMKRSDKSGYSTINSANVVVPHNLRYIPQFVYYADLDGDGILWYGGERVWSGTESTSGGGTPPPIVDAWITETELTMDPFFFTGTRAIHWLIYLDYGTA